MSKVEQIKIPMDLIQPRMVKVTKHKELENARHPYNIEEGFEIVGQFIHEPIVGNAFWLAIPNKISGSLTMNSHWRTSVVTEIIGPKMFKTMNSVYIWEDLDSV